MLWESPNRKMLLHWNSRKTERGEINQRGGVWNSMAQKTEEVGGHKSVMWSQRKKKGEMYSNKETDLFKKNSNLKLVEIIQRTSCFGSLSGREICGGPVRNTP